MEYFNGTKSNKQFFECPSTLNGFLLTQINNNAWNY